MSAVWLFEFSVKTWSQSVELSTNTEFQGNFMWVWDRSCWLWESPDDTGRVSSHTSEEWTGWVLPTQASLLYQMWRDEAVVYQSLYWSVWVNVEHELVSTVSDRLMMLMMMMLMLDTVNWFSAMYT